MVLLHWWSLSFELLFGFVLSKCQFSGGANKFDQLHIYKSDWVPLNAVQANDLWCTWSESDWIVVHDNLFDAAQNSKVTGFGCTRIHPSVHNIPKCWWCRSLSRFWCDTGSSSNPWEVRATANFKVTREDIEMQTSVRHYLMSRFTNVQGRRNPRRWTKKLANLVP